MKDLSKGFIISGKIADVESHGRGMLDQQFELYGTGRILSVVPD